VLGYWEINWIYAAADDEEEEEHDDYEDANNEDLPYCFKLGSSSFIE